MEWCKSQCRVAGARGMRENAPAMRDSRGANNEPKDPRRCFACGRELGPLLEWKKMDTEAGPICYVCFNEAASDRRREERKP
jgi:hypothetical protein